MLSMHKAPRFSLWDLWVKDSQLAADVKMLALFLKGWDQVLREAVLGHEIRLRFQTIYS